jgi:hypothetical protein
LRDGRKEECSIAEQHTLGVARRSGFTSWASQVNTGRSLSRRCERERGRGILHGQDDIIVQW